jgi:hypothetical protein
VHCVRLEQVPRAGAGLPGADVPLEAWRSRSCGCG